MKIRVCGSGLRSSSASISTMHKVAQGQRGLGVELRVDARKQQMH